MFFDAGAGLLSQGNAYLVDTVIVKVTISEKPHQLTVAKAAKKKLKKPLNLISKRASQTSDRRFQLDTTQQHYAARSVSETLFKPYEENKQLVQSTSKNFKKSNFFAGLILISLGAIMAYFYRKGGVLAMAILMLVSGYYVLLYSLLFM